MHSTPDPIQDAADCVFCGGPFDRGPAGRWFVQGDAEWAPGRGYAHTACIPWERRSPPWEHIVKQVPAELQAMAKKARAGQRLVRALRKMHREWPRDATQRVLLVEQLFADWTPYLKTAQPGQSISESSTKAHDKTHDKTAKTHDKTAKKPAKKTD